MNPALKHASVQSQGRLATDTYAGELTLTGTRDTSHKATLDGRYTFGRNVQRTVTLWFLDTADLRPTSWKPNRDVQGIGRVVVDGLLETKRSARRIDSKKHDVTHVGATTSLPMKK